MILIEDWALLITLFLKYHFCKHNFDIVLHALYFVLSFIDKELAMCRLGGVISAQKMLFLTLFIAGFEHFLCTNQRN